MKSFDISMPFDKLRVTSFSRLRVTGFNVLLASALLWSCNASDGEKAKTADNEAAPVPTETVAVRKGIEGCDG